MSLRRISSKLPGDAAASIIRRCALALLVLTIAVLAHRESRASCGDYVLVRDARGKLVSASQLAEGQRATADHPSEPMKLPCRGPKCSQLPAFPPAVPPVPIHWPSAPEAVLMHIGDGGDQPESDRPPPSSGPLHPIHDPGGIFRPPR